MKKIIRLYLVSLIAFFVIDVVWLGLIAAQMYRRYLGHLMAPQVNWSAAIFFYLLFIGGIVYFAVIPALQQNSFKQAILRGAVFGLITYATYDLTNLATLRDWPLAITLIDLAWGTLLSTSVTAVAYIAWKKMIPN